MVDIERRIERLLDQLVERGNTPAHTAHIQSRIQFLVELRKQTSE